ncbi:hypothetical protein [Amycolatopsis acidiphila]|nr:hypothetical protein [Amycolatopsis acidiphila]
MSAPRCSSSGRGNECRITAHAADVVGFVLGVPRGALPNVAES